MKDTLLPTRLPLQLNTRHTYIMCVSHLSKGRHALWRRVSLLLNMHKKESLQIILHGNAP
jgi:hypothetical protein